MSQNQKYKSVNVLNVTKSKFIQHKRGPSSVLLKLLDHVSLMPINAPGTTDKTNLLGKSLQVRCRSTVGPRWPQLVTMVDTWLRFQAEIQE